jgi:serine protease Do
MRARTLASTGCACLLLLAPLAHGQSDESHPPAVGVAAKVFPTVVKVYGAGGFTGIPGYGAGVVVDERGFVLTAWSIALRTPSLKVTAADGARYKAEVWRADSALGVALLKIRAPEAGLRAVRLGSSSNLRPGDTVFALGNPFGFIYGDELPSVQEGVVTSVGPPRSEGHDVLRLPAGLSEVVLTDIPNNPGTQGGPLLDTQGNLVGVLGRIVESRATNTIVNYAVPADAIREFVRDGIAASRPRPEPPHVSERPRRTSAVETGIRLLRAHLARPPVAYVERVARDSAAAVAGIEPDDLIFRVGGRTIRTCQDYDEVLAQAKPGRPLVFVVKRGDEVLELTLTPRELGE